MTTLSALPVTVKKLSDPTSQVPVANGLSISKTTSGAQTLLPAVAHDRIILCIAVEATEEYADNAGAQASFVVGDSDTADKYSDNINLGSASAGQQAGAGISGLFDSALEASCILAANKEIVVTCTPAIGDGTGACKIIAITVSAPG